MQHRNGDLFTTDAKIIAHGANTKGVMGAGVAKTVKEKFPWNFKRYKQYCDMGLAVPGEFVAARDEGFIVLNLFSQDMPGPNAKYEWVAGSVFSALDSLSNLDDFRTPYGNVIAIPEIGSGIGGLEWKNVEIILTAAEAVYPEFEFEVWHWV